MRTDKELSVILISSAPEIPSETLDFSKELRIWGVSLSNDDVLIDSNDRLMIYLAYLQLTEFFKTAKLS